MNIDKIISNNIGVSLSDDDILKLCKNNAKIVSYSEISKFDNIDELMGDNGAVIILYESSHNYGHWVLLFKRNNNTVSFFDSHGFFPDDELKLISKEYKKLKDMVYPYILILMNKSDYKLEYNDYQFQKFSDRIATCGRWVCVRLLFRNMSPNEFKKMFKNIKNLDAFITGLTMLM